MNEKELMNNITGLANELWAGDYNQTSGTNEAGEVSLTLRAQWVDEFVVTFAQTTEACYGAVLDALKNYQTTRVVEPANAAGTQERYIGLLEKMAASYAAEDYAALPTDAKTGDGYQATLEGIVQRVAPARWAKIGEIKELARVVFPKPRIRPAKKDDEKSAASKGDRKKQG